ncbi:MAG: hypothetical protein O7G85_00760 [Planctomycetota bacterium]|nr:hypothetical protein [Planctomycetota bacterium]
MPIIDRVVLVPDIATYVDELTKWSLEGRWPVLFEDDALTPMFIRRFQPDQILLRESVGELPGSIEDRQASLERIVVGAWGGDPHQDSIREAFANHGYFPPGVVITSVKDAAWTAAVALAAGRGLPLLWMDESFGQPDASIDIAKTKELKKLVDERIASLGYPYEELGDAIDTITMCRAIAGRVNVDLPPARRINVPEKYRDGPLAMTDVIGRRADWNRYAFTGWIHGDEATCAYVAMCSLFLPRVQVDLINSYPSDGSWALYSMDQAEDRLQTFEYEFATHHDAASSLQSWRRLIYDGLNTDVLIMNTKGNRDYFRLAQGRASSLDVPLHHVPVAVHLTHSWSMQSPTRLDTVAGRWIENGAYAYVGSMHEPMLSAFVPPTSLIERFNGLIPFLVAARHWQADGVFARPWRINTYGDPLMLCPSPRHGRSARLKQPAQYGISLETQVRESMEHIKTKPSIKIFARTIRSLHLWGRDDLAVQVWELAKQQSKAEQASESMIEVFFFLGQDEGLIEACEMSSPGTERHRDMLWHRLGVRLGPRVDRTTLLLLESGMRRSHPQFDADRLAPHFDRVLGRARTRDMIQLALSIASSQASEKRIKKLLGEYPEQ